MSISFAVMLPVGNPPNAIVFSYGHCQIKDMVSYGVPFAGPHSVRAGMVLCGLFLEPLISQQALSTLSGV